MTDAGERPTSPAGHYPWFTRGDLDGFFGLMVDNLVQVLLIITFCRTLCGMGDDLIFGRILPGVAVSLLIGNLYYSWHARQVAIRDGNYTCTALPYGINTVPLFAFILFVMAPVYRRTGDPYLAWKAGLIACLVSGITELAGAFVAEYLRKWTPRAALLGVLAAIGVTFIASDFAFRIYSKPAVGLVPLIIILLVYFANYKFPYHLPGGLIAIALGTAAAWILGYMSPAELKAAAGGVGFYPPRFAGREIASVLFDPQYLLPYMSIAVPMGLLSVLGSLQNVESAEAAGDRFSTVRCLAADGIGSIAAALFGSCFPTSIYIGHPGWKALGARTGYSILNGAFFTVLFLLGLGPIVDRLIPIEAGAAIVLWIGVVITAQAYQTTPREHAPAVAIAFFPAIAAIIALYMPLAIMDSGGTRTLADLARDLASGTGGFKAMPFLTGILALNSANSGWVVVSMIFAAASVALIERRFAIAGTWLLAGAMLNIVGAIHAFRLEGNNIRELFIWQEGFGPEVFTYRGTTLAVCYAIAALMLFGIWLRESRSIGRESAGQNAVSGPGSPDR